MKALLKKQYLDEYNLRQITKSVFNLFDDYNYKKAVAQDYIDSQYSHPMSDHLDDTRNKRGQKDAVYDVVVRRSKVVKYIESFDMKIKSLKNDFTTEELIIFEHSIIERESDKVIMDRLAMTDKTYYIVKKSCFVKIALRYNLADGFSKSVFTTISLID